MTRRLSVLPEPSPLDFVRAARPVRLSFVGRRGHLDTVIGAVREARVSVWIATANLKEMLVDWTGAGLGAKSDRNRNFELGLVTEDEAMLDDVQGLYEHLWNGGDCARCGRRELCESPLA